MRIAEVFEKVLNQNLRVRSFNKEQSKEMIYNLFATIDAINALSRGELTLSNNYLISQYSIHKCLESLIYPDSVVIVPGISNEDYLDREADCYMFNANPDVRILTPAEFKEAQTYLVSLLKIYLKDDDFVSLHRGEKVISSAEASNYSVKCKVPCENTLWPIPIKISVKREKYLNVTIDDEFISEWFLNNFFNAILNSR